MHDTVYEAHAGLLTRIIDRSGAVWAALQWSASGALVRLEVPGAVVDGAVVAHPLLGDAHAIVYAGGDAGGTTAMTALAWARPMEIPAIAEPGRLPLGAGAAILNAIAVLAERAGVASLRYAGPYPTAALWRTLSRSFRCGASEAAFTADAMARALRVARDPIAIDFAPAPHERLAIANGFVELRDGIERAVLDGIAYEPGGSPARLVEQRCEIWFGDAPYARVATLAPDGSLADGPHPLPACESAVIGREFPLALRAAIGQLVAEALPPVLADDARALLADQPLRWADLGARAAREQADGLAVHAALWERIGPLGLGRLALALAEALAPVVAAAVIRRASG
ncbi:MAG TPA: hypothetical protein VLM79_28210 [Kofleriaceae bacterium]|nr:hypothetical protein [Kofleriaceae bacterium]